MRCLPYFRNKSKRKSIFHNLFWNFTFCECHTFLRWLCTLIITTPIFFAVFVASFHRWHTCMCLYLNFRFFFISFHLNHTEMHCIRESFIVIDVPFSRLAAFYECYVAVIHNTIRYEVIRKLMKIPDKFISKWCASVQRQGHHFLTQLKKNNNCIQSIIFVWNVWSMSNGNTIPQTDGHRWKRKETVQTNTNTIQKTIHTHVYSKIKIKNHQHI